MKNKKIFILLLLVPIIIFFVGRSFSLPYTEEIKSVEIESNNYPEPGSWHITKSAEWTGFGKAKVTFDVNSVMETVDGRYKDIILVIDVSGSMLEQKLSKAKSDSIDLTNYLLSDNHNSIALVTFDTTSTIVSNFVNNKDTMVDYLNNLSASGITNYNSALQNVDVVMNDYVRKENTDLVVLFLTDGYPNEDTPNEVATYHMLKDKYPYMTINGIQYEMGKDIIQEIIDITDNQWVADMDTLNNVLFDASISPIVYDNFVVEDYINDEYFYINSIDDVEVPFGNIALDEENGVQKIIWDLGNNYKTGDTIQMKIDLQLKEEYHETEGFYPTNLSEKIVSKKINENEKIVNSNLTPILNTTYYVIYDSNMPSDCQQISIVQEKHYVYQNVTKRQDKLSCQGYIFNGWIIEDDDRYNIKIINDDEFIMPNFDVHIKATWTKEKLIKRMNGTIHEKTTLYKVLKDEAKRGTYAKKYSNNHQDSIDNHGNKEVYYFNAKSNSNATAITNKDNVIFAKQCWKILRTTDTGGVKLIYNGEPENDKCLNTRGNHIGYNEESSLDLSGTYYYGDAYVYNKESNRFSLSGNIEEISINSTNASTIIPTLKSKYTCKLNSSDGTCVGVYFIIDYYESTKAYISSISKNSHYSQFGILNYSRNFSLPLTQVKPSSLADIGYMNNKRYTADKIKLTSSETILSSTTINTSYWYADSVTWGTPTANRYNLDNPYQISNTSAYSNLVGKYTFMSTSSSSHYSYINYIVAVDGSTMYYIELYNGNDLSQYDLTYTYGDGYSDNGDGTYLLNNAKTVKKTEWFDKYNDVTHKYLCKNAINNTCDEILYVTSASNRMANYMGIVKYGTSFTYVCDDNNNNNCKYVLNSDESELVNAQDNYERYDISYYHYTCWNISGECSTISYIYYVYGTSPYLYYIELENGKSIEDAIEEMISLDNENYHVNTNDSLIKQGIDAWYKNYIYNDYDKYIEDTIYCDDRSISNFGGWNPESGSITSYINFGESSDLTCINETDKFSTLNDKAKLKYKVGLATTHEINLLSQNYYLDVTKTGVNYYLMNPKNYDEYGPFIYYVNDMGYTGGSSAQIGGLRPVISLRPGIEYKRGNGRMDNPYVIDTDY